MPGYEKQKKTHILCVTLILHSSLLRELPGLAKNYVMRMLFLEQPLRQAAVALWVKKEYVK